MRQRVPAIVSAVWFALCAATLVLWALGWWRGIRVGNGGAARADGSVTSWEIGSGFGGFGYRYAYRRDDATMPSRADPRGIYADVGQYNRFDFIQLAPRIDRRLLGFWFRWWDDSYTYPSGGKHVFQRVRIIAPCWAAALGFGMLPAMRLIARRSRARRELRGECLQCGYDLRATPRRCPECGTEVNLQASTA